MTLSEREERARGIRVSRRKLQNHPKPQYLPKKGVIVQDIGTGTCLRLIVGGPFFPPPHTCGVPPHDPLIFVASREDNAWRICLSLHHHQAGRLGSGGEEGGESGALLLAEGDLDTDFAMMVGSSVFISCHVSQKQFSCG